MSDIVKWTAGGLVKASGAELERRVQETLELLREEAPPQQPRRGGGESIAMHDRVNRLVPRDRPKIIAAPRRCSIRGEDFVAYYESIDGVYQHTTTGILTAQVCRVSFTRDAEGAEIREGLQSEECPFCGVSRRPILCHNCKTRMCGGRVHGNYFRCFCGAEGFITDTAPCDRGRAPSGWSERR